MSDDLFSLLLRSNGEDAIEQRLEDMVADANKGIVRVLSEDNVDRPYLVTMVAGVYVVDDPSLPIVQIQDRANVARKKAGGGTERISAGGRLCSCRFYRERDGACLAVEKEFDNRMSRCV